MLGLLTGALKAVGSTLARAGVIRGTLGKVLGGAATSAAGTIAGGMMLPSMGQPNPMGLVPYNPNAVPQLPQMGVGTSMVRLLPGVGRVAAGAGGALAAAGVGGALVRGAAGTVTKRYGKKVLGLIASGILFEAGGKLWNAITGQEHKEKRRMNYSNMKALKRGIRRVEGASKQYARILRATQGGVKKCGYTVKPKSKRARCG
jgi:hypothetical protein